jgi:hypothetical protein
VPTTAPADGAPIATGRLIFHPQEAIRLAARALKEHWGSGDTFQLARFALEAAHPSDRHMLEAFAPPILARPKPPQQEPIAELHA